MNFDEIERNGTCNKMVPVANGVNFLLGREIAFESLAEPKLVRSNPKNDSLPCEKEGNVFNCENNKFE